MRPPSGVALLAEAGMRYRVVPLSSVVRYRPAGTPGAKGTFPPKQEVS